MELDDMIKFQEKFNERCTKLLHQKQQILLKSEDGS